MSFIRRRTSVDPIPTPPALPNQTPTPAYPPPPLYVSTARVSPNVINFTLRPRDKASLPPPSVELDGAISHGEWFSRVERVRALLMRYEWSVLERVAVVAGVLALIAVPVVLSATVGRMIVDNAEKAHPVVIADDRVGDVPGPVRRAVFESRAITLGSFFLLLAILVAPYGQKKLGALLHQFDAQPTGPSRDPASRLAWQIKSISLYGQSAILQITLPLSASPTVFHPNAYLPEYMVKMGEDPNARGGPGAVGILGGVGEGEWIDLKR